MEMCVKCGHPLGYHHKDGSAFFKCAVIFDACECKCVLKTLKDGVE